MASDIQSLRKQLTGTLVSGPLDEGRGGMALGLGPAVVPLEPRMLMDASLGWDMSGDTPVIDMLSGLHALVEHQVHHFEDFIGHFEGLAHTALDGLDALSTSSNHDAALTQLMDHLRDAIGALAKSADAALADIFDDKGFDFDATLAGKLSTALGVSIHASDVEAAFSTDATATTDDSLVAAIKAGTVSSHIADFASYITTHFGAPANGNLGDILNTALNETLLMAGQTFTLHLTDDVAAGISFDAGSAGGVDVTVDAAALVRDFSPLGAAFRDGFTLPQGALLVTGDTGAVTFRLAAEQSPTDVGLSVTKLDFGDLMAIGGDHVTLSGGPTDLSLGLLSLRTTDASLAEFRLAATLADGLDLGVTHKLGTATFTDKIAADDAVTAVSLQIRAVGASDFVDVDKTASYAVAAVNGTGHLSLLSGVIDAGKTADFAAHLSLVGSFGAATPAAFISGLHQSFDADLTGKVADGASRARLEGALEGLAAMNGVGLSQFLKDTSALVSGLLRTALFDVNFNFTDLDVTKVYADIAKVFDGIDEAFLIDPAVLGYTPNASGNVATMVEISNAISARTAVNDLPSLANVAELKFVIFSGADKKRTEVTVTLDDATRNAATASARATALAALLDTKLADYSISTSASGGKLTISADNPNALPALSLVGAKVSGNYTTNYGLSDLGFGSAQLYSATGVFVPPASATAAKETDQGLKLVPAKTVLFAPSADITSLEVDRIAYTVTIGDRVTDVWLQKPASGWAVSGADMVAALNAAFAKSGVPLEASVLSYPLAGPGVPAQPDAIAIATTAAAGIDTVQFGVDPTKLLRAYDIDSLVGWVNGRLADLPDLKGVALRLSSDGALFLDFPDVEKSLTLAPNAAGTNFSASGLSDGEISDLSLQGRLQAVLKATFGASVGIDLVDYAQNLAKSATGGATLYELTRNLDGAATKTAIDAAAATRAGAQRMAMVAEGVQMDGTLNASATGVTGSASLGLINLDIGADSARAADNRLELGAEFHLGLATLDDDGKLTDRISMTRLLEAAQENASPSGDAIRNYSSILGAVQVQGGLGADAVQMQATLGDVRAVFDGIDGLGQTLIGSLGVTIGALDRADATTTITVDANDVDTVNTLSTLTAGDITDSFTAVLNLVTSLGTVLRDQIDVLGEKLPLLNFSLADRLNLTRDFAQQVADFRQSGNFGFGALNGALAAAFGDGVATVAWDADAHTLRFNLNLEFLKDYAEDLPFKLDLAAIFGGKDKLAEFLSEDAFGKDVTNLVRALSSLRDVAGDANLSFDPDLSMNLSFGIQLAAAGGDVADADTALTDLTSVVAVIDNTAGQGADLRLDWRDAFGAVKSTTVDLGRAATLGEVVSLLDARIKSLSKTAYVELQDGVVVMGDTAATGMDQSGVRSLFGEGYAEFGAGTDTAGLTVGPSTYQAGASFTLFVGGQNGTPRSEVVVHLDADATRDTPQEFAAAFNALLSTVAVPRLAVDPTAPVSATLPASMVLRLRVDGQNLVLEPASLGLDNDQRAVAFAVGGIASDAGIALRVTELGTSNFGRLLGLTNLGVYTSGEMRGAVLTTGAGKSVVLDVAESGLELTMQAGATEGLNLKLGFGSMTIDVSNGAAFLTAGTDSEDPAYMTFGFVDGDGVDDGLFDLGSLYAPAGDLAASDLFTLDMGVAINMDLAFSDTSGILNPEDHGVSYHADLLVTDGATVLTDLVGDAAHLADSGVLTGDVVDGVVIGTGDDAEFSLTLPVVDLIDVLAGANGNLLSFLNDPRTLLSGLDSILGQIQRMIDNFMNTINLPLIGDQLKSATTFFDDIRYGILADAREAAETPDENGVLPTTIDLVTGLVNNLLNNLFGTHEQFFQLALFGDDLPEERWLKSEYMRNNFGYIGGANFSIFDMTPEDQAAYNDLRTPYEKENFFQERLIAARIIAGAEAYDEHFGDGDNTFLEGAYLYGALNFGAVIWQGEFALDMNLGGFGFNLDVDDGSTIKLTLDYFVNLGFGLDKNGFFLLNTESVPEIAIQFTADAGTFDGSAKLFGLLGIKVDALTYENGTYTDQGAGGGTAEVKGIVGINLFGGQGTDIIDPTDPNQNSLVGMVRDLSDIHPVDGAGNDLGYDKILYLSDLDTEHLVSFTFTATVEICLGLEGNILDPTDPNHDPILFGGKKIIPTVYTELRFRAFYLYDPLAEEDERNTFEITELAFDNVRISAKDLYDSLIAPVLDPIMEFINPLVDAFDWLNDVPFKYLVDYGRYLFPILGIIGDVQRTISGIKAFQEQMGRDGTYSFGSFDYTDELAVYYSQSGAGEADLAEMNARRAGGSSTGGVAGNPFGVFGNLNGGFAVEIPLLSDYHNIINLIMGDYANVDLVKLHMNLFKFDLPRTSFSDLLLDKIGAPGWVQDIISGVFKFEMGAHFKAGITVGYDLGGILNFVNTLDPERLLDGVFIDSTKGNLLSAGFEILLELNLGIAGLKTGGGVSIDIGFNDPNHDGKLRIPELLALLDAAANASSAADALGYIFEGEFDINFYLKVWAGIVIDFGFFELDLSWDTTVFDFDESIHFGGANLPVGPAPHVGAGETAILAVGSNVGASLSNITKDGDDIIRLDGPNSPIQVYLSTNQGSISSTGSNGINPNAGGIIIPAGEGNNQVDLSQLNDNPAYAPIPVIVYAGGGTDTIKLPSRGLVVVFAGAGDDRITADPGATGTYVIFGDAGSETVNIPGGNVLFFGDDDFGMRDLLIQKYKDGGLTQANLCDVLGINPDGTVRPGGAASYTEVGGGKVSLDTLLTNYTRTTQTGASSAAETLTLGGGNHVILTGGGNDRITVTGTNGVIKVYSGAGADELNLGGADLYVEAGAGSDRIFTTALKSDVWGWGKQAGENGQLSDGTTAGRAIDAMAIRDGADLMIGGGGNDMFHGQLGSDILEGNDGADRLFGGAGIDLITGGKFVITSTTVPAVTIDLASVNPANGFGRGINLGVADRADGADSLVGGDEADVLLGGGGNDTILGERGADLIVGDFAVVKLSANLIVEAVETTFDTSANAGTDSLLGGAGNDILIAGGSGAGEVEVITDLEGSNVVLGDFGKLSGARLADAVTKVESYRSIRGGADSIILGDGNDMVVGGEGNDTIRTGNGGDIVLADLGTISITDKLIKSDADPTATWGDDDVTVGNGAGFDIADIVILGRGDDRLVSSGVGGLTVLGDDGQITLDPIAVGALRGFIPPGDAATRARIDDIAKVVTSWATAGSGDDTLEATRTRVTAVMGGADDSVTVGDGETYILGDDGTIERLTSNTLLKDGAILTANTDRTAGNDNITLGTGRSAVVAGLGDDVIKAGKADHAIMTDEGTLTIRRAGGTADNPLGVTLVGANTTGGNDRVTADDGDMTILMGFGNDSLTAANGDFVVLADQGQITRTAAQIELTDSAATGGNDSLTVGDGDQTILMGLGNDTASVGDGDSAIMADQGKLTRTAAQIELTDSAATGGNDSLTVGDGDQTILMGLGNDTASVGDGDSAIMADQGKLTRTAAQIELTDSAATGGNDSLTVGDGDQTILMGLGNDTASVGDGDSAIMADQGKLTRTAAQIELTDSAATGGNDSLTVGDGDQTILMGLGNDTASVGDGDSAIMADQGKLTRTAAQIDLTDSAATGGNDSLTAGDGDLTILMGLGNDTASLGEGDSAVLGDKGHMLRTATLIDLTDIVGAGGNDSLTTLNGDMTVIMGLGNDTVKAGNGDGAYLGDQGTILRSATSATLEDTLAAGGGNDSIGTGSGKDTILGGTGNDSLAAGDGDNVVFGDMGKVVWATNGDLSLTSPAKPGDGNDTVDTGSGRDLVILGGGADKATLGSGMDYVLGDSGTINTVGIKISLATTDNAIGGSDTIAGNAGNDVIIGGAAGDSLSGDSNDDILLGDQGTVVFTTAQQVDVVSEDTLYGGNDTIQGGSDRDVIIAGLGDDSVTGGQGDDAILGDLGNYGYPTTVVVPPFSVTTNVYHLFSLNSAPAGRDTIEGNENDDIIIAGLGDDSVDVGTGEDLALGDSGQVTFENTADIRTLVLTESTVGGDDTIVAAGAVGDDILIGQMGNDSITAAGSDDIVLGDTALITLATPASALPNESAADRVVRIEGVLMDSAGNDTLSGGAGLDLIMGGFGADLIRGGDAQDMLIGDSAVVEQVFTFNAAKLFAPIAGAKPGDLYELRTLDTNFDYETGGIDTIYGDAGADIIVGGLGNDLFFGDTANDLIYSDGFYGIFEAAHGDAFNTNPMSNLQLMQSNFAGQGAVDVVSDSQQAASIGASLNLVEDPGPSFLPDLLTIAADEGQLGAEDLLKIVAADPSLLEAVARLIMIGADAGLIARSVAGELAASGAFSGSIDPLQLELLLQSLMENLNRKTAGLDAHDLRFAAE